MTPCELCKGACCHSLVIPINQDANVYDWLRYHGEERPHGIALDCKCSKLSHGRCTIYDGRPEVCRAYAVGSLPCLDAIERHHNRKNRRRILEAIAEELNLNTK